VIGGTIRHFDECESTNDEALKWARQIHDSAPHGGVIVADFQRAGRGRLGRVWHSPPGSNLYFSVVLRLLLPMERVPPITLCAGLAVCEVVNTRGVKASIKWPNDVLVGANKLAGVLTEMSSQSHRPATDGAANHGALGMQTVIVGVGLNVNCESFPGDLSATSLKIESGGQVDRTELLGEILSSMHTWVERYCAHGVSALQKAFEGHNMLAGHLVRAKVGGVLVQGRVVSLSDEGSLLMRDNGGLEHKIVAGEIECIEEEIHE